MESNHSDVEGWMGAMTRAESIKREQAVLKFFIENPTATGDAAQQALVAGTLTCESGPPMGIGKLFRLRRQALELAHGGTVAALTPPDAAQSASLLADLKTLTSEIQTVLGCLPDVAEVRVTRDGAKVLRMVTREEPLT